MEPLAGPEGNEVRGVRRGVGLGFLAMTPLFLAYEWSVHLAGPDGARNTSELLLSRVLRPFGAYEGLVRFGLLVLLAFAAFAQARLAGARIGRSILGLILEGALAALALGPVLALLLALFDVSARDLLLPAAPAPQSPGLLAAGRLVGAGAYEEMLFRVGLYSLLFLLARRLATFLGAPQGVARLIAELVGLTLSSLAFAAFHLELVTRSLGGGGERFDGMVFLWRALAGALLAVLFRWRGPGVAAWAHGLFNLALALGSGPGVFR